MQKTNASKRIALVEKPDYRIDLEYGSVDGKDYAILHLPVVNRFTKSVYLDIKIVVENIWEFLSDIHYKDMFCAILKENEVTKKFASRIGFVYLGDDAEYSVYQYKEFK